MKKIYHISIIICITILSIYFYNYPLNEDSVWIIYSTQNMLHGATLYTDIVETNPPLIFLLNTIPLFFAKLMTISITHSYIIFVFLLICISLYLSNIIFKANSNISTSQRYLLQTALLVSLSILPSGDFGEREHLFIIFIFPYILMMMFQDKIKLSKKETIFISLFSVLGFNIKPYFFFTFIIAETIYFLYHRSIKTLFRTQTLIIGISGFVYLGIIYIFFIEYYDVLLPLVISSYSDAFKKSFFDLILFHINDLMLISIFTISTLIFVYKRKQLDLSMLLSLIYSLVILYFYQQKGWHYHLLPAFILTSFSFFYILIVYINKENYKFTALGAILILLISFENRYINRYQYISNILNNFKPHSKVLILSTDIARGLPLVVQSHHLWCSRFPSLWMLPKVAKDPSKRSLQNYMNNAIYKDMLKYKPDYIITDQFVYNYTIKEYEPLTDLIEKKYKKLQNSTNLVYKREE